MSIVEIYMEKIRDLLDISKSNLKVRENKGKGIYLSFYFKLTKLKIIIKLNKKKTEGVYIEDVTE